MNNIKVLRDSMSDMINDTVNRLIELTADQIPKLIPLQCGEEADHLTFRVGCGEAFSHP